VENSAGGFSWEVDSWTHLRRFLILGSEGGTYYTSEKNLTNQGLKNIEKCVALDGARVVSEILEISEGGLAPKNDYAIFALAVAVAKGDAATKRLALSALNRVCRIGTHLFMFCDFLDNLGSLTGRAKRRALAKWYTDRPANSVAYQAVKYRQRNGWTHRDVLRLAHPARKVTSGNPVVSVSEDHAAIFDWISGRKTDGVWPNELKILAGFEMAQKAATKRDAVNIIRDYSLPREAVPTEFLVEPEVWQALLDIDMPYTALMRNLANMTRIGLLTGTSAATKTVIAKLTNEEAIKKARVHPINILFALKTYQSGVGFRGGNSWTPVQRIVDALNDAFYASFKFVEPSGKRILLALDISGSMDWGTIAGTNISPREASAALALVTAATEESYDIVGFSRELIPLNVSPKMRLDTVLREISGLPFGGTDCAAPMEWARKNKREYDAFVVYTDSETWAGVVHPAKALKNYRKSSGIVDARLVVVGMVSNNFTIADPKDPGMLDVVGFDTTTPQVVSNFIAGKI
jgi:60 kDa SS-A/Ro ribonucleoprotein